MERALVTLLSGTRTIEVNETGADGRFLFEDLPLGSCALEFRALGFVSRTLTAEPTEVGPSVDLGDIALTPTGDSGSGTGGSDLGVTSSWILIAIAIAALVLALLAFLVYVRRRRQEEAASDTAAGAEASDSDELAAEPKEAVSSGEGSSSAAASLAGLVFDCPVCGRLVTEATTRCVCGAEFDG